jgi:hypothetical protein
MTMTTTTITAPDDEAIPAEMTHRQYLLALNNVYSGYGDDDAVDEDHQDLSWLVPEE